ncbi:MAG TPA: ABC transporter ATP-binding protein [Candidatus Babeliales bacterium]|jgi:ABC-type lipoprotein export system ATPase subunit|nr:ABC transporter ATP-binding protein [Candidatus Babeliales bacterium]
MIYNQTLEVKNVSKTFNHHQVQHTILNNITIQFHQGSTYAITGVSGSGKSTFMHLLAGLDTPTSGTIIYQHNSLTSMSAQQRSLFLNKSIGLLFQNPYLIRELSVIENVMVPALIAKTSYQTAYNNAYALLKQVGLESKENLVPSILSGGEQQRVALARALCNKPAFLLADEPTGSLDEHTARTIIDLLVYCQQTWHMGLIVSTHDIQVARAMHYIYMLHDGILTLKQ